MATLNLSFTVPDAQATAIQDDLCAYWGYTGAAGETKVQFIKRKIGEHLFNAVMAARVKAAADAAAVTASAATSTAVTFT